MHSIKRFVSTNGRWGLEIFSPEAGLSLDAPIRGTVRHMGATAGFQALVITPDPTAQTWVWVTGEAEPVDGCSVIACEGLQSGRCVTLLLLGPTALIGTHGYRRRSANVTLFLNGVAQDLSSAHLLALGLVDPVEEPPEVDSPPMSALADKLAQLGFVASGQEEALVVTRHQGMVAWLAGRGITGDVVSHATPENVRGKNVVGVLPLALAAEANTITTVSMPGLKPEQRGQDLSPEEMDAAGARLEKFSVSRMEV